MGVAKRYERLAPLLNDLRTPRSYGLFSPQARAVARLLAWLKSDGLQRDSARTRAVVP